MKGQLLEKIQLHGKGNVYKSVQIQIHSTHEKNVKQSFFFKECKTKFCSSQVKKRLNTCLGPLTYF